MTSDDESVQAFLERIERPVRRRDAQTLLDLMGRATGEPPQVRGTMVGFGQYHYKYESGREGDAAAAAFAARKSATTIYLMDGVDAHTDDLERLGPHTTGAGCVYIKDLAAVDLDVLERIVASSYAAVTAGTYGRHADETGKVT